MTKRYSVMDGGDVVSSHDDMTDAFDSAGFSSELHVWDNEAQREVGCEEYE